MSRQTDMRKFVGVPGFIIPCLSFPATVDGWVAPNPVNFKHSSEQ